MERTGGTQRLEMIIFVPFKIGYDVKLNDFELTVFHITVNDQNPISELHQKLNKWLFGIKTAVCVYGFEFFNNI